MPKVLSSRLAFRMYQSFKKYVCALTYHTLGDIIENLIPEGECVVSLVSVKDQSELDVGMTQACLDVFDIQCNKVIELMASLGIGSPPPPSQCETIGIHCGDVDVVDMNAHEELREMFVQFVWPVKISNTKYC